MLKDFNHMVLELIPLHIFLFVSKSKELILLSEYVKSIYLPKKLIVMFNKS